MRLALVDAPMGIGAGNIGTHLGPTAIHTNGLTQRLRDLGHTIETHITLDLPELPTGEIGDPRMKYADEVIAGAEEIANTIAAIPPDTMVITLGGDHSIALGTVTGAAKRHERQPLGLLWVDTHGDFNTCETSPSGNIHGMPLAALAGVGNPRLTQIGGFSPKISPERIVIFGARSLDSNPAREIDERRLLRQHNIHVFTMRQIDDLGLAQAASQAIALATMDGAPLHVSFDIDVVDPSEAPGTGTREPGGLTYREARLLMELIAESGKLTSLDLVEVNPLLDQGGKTSRLAAALICSALGAQLF